METDTQDAVPENFAAAATLLQSLIAKRRLLKDTLETKAIISAFELVGRAALEGNVSERFQAIALLGKTSEISKPLATYSRPLLVNSLRRPLMPLEDWGSADDRYYLAKAISTSEEPWVRLYAATELGRGDVAERASRTVWADIAINRAETLAKALELIGTAFAQDTQHTSAPLDTAARKLNRVVAALQDPLPVADVEIGEGFGKALSRLILESSGNGGPHDRELREETATGLLTLMIQVLRLRFEATLDTDVYGAVGTILRWWYPAQPPETVRSKADRIARIAMNSLHTLARQGLSQNTMRQSLASAFGTELINRIGTEAAGKDPSLNYDTAFWLANGRTPTETKENAAVREISEHDLDHLVARLLLSFESQEGDQTSLNMLADQIELLEPRHASTIRTITSRSRIASQWAHAISTKRNLILSGQRGDLVQFNPALHETDDAIQLTSSVRITTPGVLKQQDGRQTRVILKCQVEKP